MDADNHQLDEAQLAFVKSVNPCPYFEGDWGSNGDCNPRKDFIQLSRIPDVDKPAFYECTRKLQTYYVKDFYSRTLKDTRYDIGIGEEIRDLDYRRDPDASSCYVIVRNLLP
jgi:hypothetical protein